MRQMLLFVWVLWSVPGQADSWPEFPTPKNSVVTVVAEDMVFNGVSMRSWAMDSIQSHEEVSAFYRGVWAEPAAPGMPGYVEKETDQWLVFSRLQDDHLLTAQILIDGSPSSHALLAITKVEAMTNSKTLGAGFPLQKDSEVINDIGATDQNKTSRTLVILSPSSIQHTIRFYRRQFSNRGWKEQTEGHEFGERGGALLFRKGSEELNIAITPQEQKTAVVVVRTRE